MLWYEGSTYVSLSPCQVVAHRGIVMRHWIAITGLLVCGSAFAGQADICFSPAVADGQTGKLTAETMLNCSAAGRHTLPQLASAGWMVASVQPVVVDYQVDPATQAPHSSSAWMVVIQKESR